MKFENIIRHIKDAKKVRRKCWGKYCYIQIEYNPSTGKVEFLNQNQNDFSLSADSILADDWEIVCDEM